MRRNRLVLLGTFLALLGLARLASIVFHEPLAGYANQYDMLRIEACVGLYPDLPEPRRYEGTPEAPRARYVRGEPRPQSCRPGSELLFVQAGLLAAQVFVADRSHVDLRWVGGAKWGFAAAMVLLVTALLRQYPVASLLHGATVLLVLADPMVGLWFNTLYSETATLLGAYLTLALLAAIALRGVAGPLAWILLWAAILLLGLSKHQFFALPLALVVVALPSLWHAGRRGAMATIVAALVPIAAFFVPGNEGAYRANRVDTYLYALAGASDVPSRTLAALGLPPRCSVFVGTTYYRLRGESIESECPEVFKLSPVAFVELAASEPRTLVSALARALAPSQNVYYGTVGVLAGRENASVDSLQPWARSAWQALFTDLRPSWYAGLAMLALMASFVALLVGGWRAASPAGVLAGYAAMLAVCYAYTFATAVLGDGAADAGKQALLAGVSLAAWLLAAPALLLAPIGAGRGVAVAGLAILAWLAGIVLAAWLATLYRMEHLAIGVIDAPAGNRLPPGDATVRGWALDPVGVTAVDAELDGRRIAAAAGLPHPGTQRVFPSFPRAGHAGFSIEVPAAMLPPGTHDLRVYATNRLGVRTEVDRRRLVIGSPPARG